MQIRSDSLRCTGACGGRKRSVRALGIFSGDIHGNEERVRNELIKQCISQVFDLQVRKQLVKDYATLNAGR